MQARCDHDFRYRGFRGRRLVGSLAQQRALGDNEDRSIRAGPGRQPELSQDIGQCSRVIRSGRRVERHFVGYQVTRVYDLVATGDQLLEVIQQADLPVLRVAGFCRPEGKCRANGDQETRTHAAILDDGCRSANSRIAGFPSGPR